MFHIRNVYSKFSLLFLYSSFVCLCTNSPIRNIIRAVSTYCTVYCSMQHWGALASFDQIASSEKWMCYCTIPQISKQYRKTVKSAKNQFALSEDRCFKTWTCPFKMRFFFIIKRFQSKSMGHQKNSLLYERKVNRAGTSPLTKKERMSDSLIF